MPTFKKVSADEAQTNREKHMRGGAGGGQLVKAAKAPPSYDKDRRSARFIMTTQQVDRYGDIVVTAGADMTEFLRNPVGLLFHSSRTWPVANWTNVESILKGRPPRMEGDFEILAPGGPVPEVDQCAWMIENGGIRACSIGFMPDWDNVEMVMDDDGQWTYGYRFNEWELTECSVCAIPANAGALVKSAEGDGRLAQELLEEVLDNWVKTPEGLLLSREDFEKTYQTIVVKREGTIKLSKPSVFVTDKAVPVVEATQQVDANAEVIAPNQITAKQVFDIDLSTGKRTISVVEATDEVVQKAVDAFIKGADSTAKFFSSVVDDALEIVRGKGVDAVTLRIKGYGAEQADKVHDLIQVAMTAQAEKQAEPAPLADASLETANIGALTSQNLQVVVSKESVAAEIKAAAEIRTEAKTLGTMLGSFFGKFEKFFTTEKQERTEPVIVPAAPPPAPAKAEDIAAAKAKAAATRDRLIGKGLIEA